MKNFISDMFGDYSSSVPGTFFSADKEAEAATPAVGKIIDKRLVTIDEPSKNLDVFKLKRYTGGESISYRKLYEE